MSDSGNTVDMDIIQDSLSELAVLMGKELEDYDGEGSQDSCVNNLLQDVIKAWNTRHSDNYLSVEKRYRARLLEWRGISERNDAVCSDCHGSGNKTYANTSTWGHGIGGQAITNDICDKCWGSGKENKPWVNLRELKQPPPKEDKT